MKKQTNSEKKLSARQSLIKKVSDSKKKKKIRLKDWAEKLKSIEKERERRRELAKNNKEFLKSLKTNSTRII